MRVAIVTGPFPRASQTFIRRHLDHLFGGKTVLVAGWLEAHEPERPAFGVYRDGLQSSRRRLRQLTNLAVGRPLDAVAGARRRALVHFLQTYKVDCLLAEFAVPAGIVVPVVQELGLPLVVYCRGYDASAALARRSGRYNLRRILPRARAVITVAEALARQLAAAGLAHPHTHVLPSGVDTAAFRPGAKETDLLLFVGRFIPKKAPLQVLRALARLRRRGSAARLVMIGDGPLRGPAETLAAELGIADAVTFAGAGDRATVQDAMARAAILVQPSVMAPDGDTEGLPSVIQEALAAEAAVVATRHAGIPEIVAHDRNGWLVDDAEPAGLAEALAILLADPVRRQRLAAAGRATARRDLDCWAIQAQLEAWLTHYCARTMP